MKDYTNITGLDKDTFMTDVSDLDTEDGKRYQVSYANGDVEPNVEFTRENEAAIEKRLAHQAEEAIANKGVLVKKQRTGFFGSIAAGALTGATAMASSFYIPEEMQVPVMAIGTGLLAIGGIIGCVYKKHMQSYVDEVSCLEERKDEKDKILDYLTTSPNAYLALAGANDEEKITRAGQIADMISEGRDPLSYLALETGEGVTLGEGKQLIKRDKREKELGLTYTDGYSIGTAASHK